MKNKLYSLLSILLTVSSLGATFMLQETSTAFTTSTTITSIAAPYKWTPQVYAGAVLDYRCTILSVTATNPDITSYTAQLSTNSNFSGARSYILTTSGYASGIQDIYGLQMNTNYYFRAKPNIGPRQEYTETQTFNSGSAIFPLWPNDPKCGVTRNTIKF